MSIQILSVVIILLIVIGTVLRFKVFKGKPADFWRFAGVPLATPVLVAAFGIVFSLLSDANYDHQKKGELLREVVASKDRPDIAFITAVGDQLVSRLKSRDKIIASEKTADNNIGPAARSDLQRAQTFEERAVYFFYGMFHSALIDFHASKGYQLYPRLWMEEAFFQLTNRVNELANGGQDETHTYQSEIELSALYKYFGAAAATFKNITDRPGEPTKAAVLFDFNLMLDRVERRTDPSLANDQYQIHLEDTLRKGCERFQARLNSGAINVQQLELTIATITALDDYGFNKLFATWYQGPDSPNEVKSLDSEIPGRISPTPPSEYLFYPLHNWEGQDIRNSTWQIVFHSVSRKFQRLEK